ncbi:single-stranded DNA-binding protein [Mycoplasma yeatsii]|uniref:single-stranded DNA-binding protein n=1 Tax=Mycoplasma yeatsii TaxID=51365 RepID=UPI0005B24316|nr:single-stranded DNA-binding protein [Mycoplasma yeatsii]AJM71551.1 single-stranded DNA-binding protein [Mycoplasma yeatsii GM274B]
MNQVILIGRLVRDEFYEKEFDKQNNEKGKLLKFTLATLESREIKTQFIEVTCYDKLAEITKEHLKKGDLISLIGVAQNNVFKTKDDKQTSKLEIIANRIKFLAKAETINELKHYKQLAQEQQQAIQEINSMLDEQYK